MTTAAFLTKLQLEDIDGEQALLLAPLGFYSAQLTETFVVPAGFMTDFASIPRGLWNIIPKRGKHDKAAVLHDAIYRNVIDGTKAEADGLFREAMAASGVGWFSRNLMYLAVVVFGGSSYHKSQRSSK